MYTRASSIRSNYTTASTKTKFMIPQRIVGGNESLQHYNALQIADTPAMKNNNVMNGNHNWTSVKSSWPFNQTSMVANGTVVEWQDKKCVCFSKIYCKSNEHPSCTTTMAKASSIPLSMQNNKINTLIEPLTNNMNTATTIYSHDTAKNCCHCHDQRKTHCKQNIFDTERRCMPTTTAVEWEQMKLCTTDSGANKFKCDVKHENNDDDDDNDGTDDTDFAREIIRINNIYNNCNASVNANATCQGESLTAANEFHLHGFNNSCISMRKFKNDINL